MHKKVLQCVNVAVSWNNQCVPVHKWNKIRTATTRSENPPYEDNQYVHYTVSYNAQYLNSKEFL